MAIKKAAQNILTKTLELISEYENLIKELNSFEGNILAAFTKMSLSKVNTLLDDFKEITIISKIKEDADKVIDAINAFSEAVFKQKVIVREEIPVYFKSQISSKIETLRKKIKEALV